MKKYFLTLIFLLTSSMSTWSARHHIDTHSYSWPYNAQLIVWGTYTCSPNGYGSQMPYNFHNLDMVSETQAGSITFDFNQKHLNTTIQMSPITGTWRDFSNYQYQGRMTIRTFIVTQPGVAPEIRRDVFKEGQRDFYLDCY